MSGKAEAAWEAWAGEQGDDIIDQPSNLAVRAFFAGYAAAQADTERLVRVAVEATKEDAMKIARDSRSPYGAHRGIRHMVDVERIAKQVLGKEV